MFGLRFLSESSPSTYLQFLSDLQEIIQIILKDLNLSLVDLVQHKAQASGVHSAEVEQRIGVRIFPKDRFEEVTGG